MAQSNELHDCSEVNDEDNHVEKFSNIAQLYLSKKYHRKAAFYRRIAALNAISADRPNPDWKKCYNLLLSSLEGYRLTLDPIEYEKRLKNRTMGWIGIHLKILCEMFKAAKNMNCDQLAIRHLSFILQCLCEVLTPSQKADFAKELKRLESKSGETAPGMIILEKNFKIFSVNMTKFPIVTQFKIQNLFLTSRPIKLKTKHRDSITPVPSSPFIFTPLRRPSSRRRSLVTSQHSIRPVDFKWIQDEICVVLLQITNCLPIELQVNHISLLTDGVPFETFPTSLTLPAESDPFPVHLTGIPRGSGKLEILGYTTHVLGVKSDCRLADLPNAKKMKLPHKYTIDVIASLPLIGVSCDLELLKTNALTSFSVDSQDIMNIFNLSIYSGQSKKVSIQISNKSLNSEMIEIILIKLKTKLPKNLESRLITWNDDQINNSLPLAAGASFELTFNVYGISDFVFNEDKLLSKSQVKSFSPNSGRRLSSHVCSIEGSSKKHNTFGTVLANFLSDFQSPSFSKGKQSITEKSDQKLFQNKIKTIEAILEFEYTGSSGLASGYCRNWALAIDIKILPSILITHWGVLPAETPSNCYLVFDVLNAADSEMELKYSQNKSILIEPKETCRIPVPVKRCPLFDKGKKLSRKFTDETHIQEICKSHLMSQVNLEWILLSSDISGTGSISSITWTDSMLDVILMSSLQFEVTVNDLILKPEQEFTYSIGETINLDIIVINCCNNALRDLQLSISCYQDYQNGNKNYRMDLKRAIIGSDCIYIEEIPIKRNYLHKCAFIFFYSGLYKVEIECTGYDKELSFLSKKTSSSNLELNSIQNEDESTHINYLKNSSLSLSTWKCSPIIELTIVE